jgi:hypothetical protein
VTNLTDKFEALEAQIASNQTALVTKLDAIIAALEGMGTPPQYTLADVLESLSEVIIAIQGLAANQLDGNTQIGQVRGSLSSLSGLISSGNTTRNSILQFLTTNNWCCTESPWEDFPVPLTTTPSTDDEGRCKRSQRAADIIIDAIDGFDVLLQQVGPTTSNDVYAVYQIIRDTGPTYAPTGNELSHMAFAINNARSAGLSNIGGLVFSFKTELFNTIYSSTSAANARQNLVSWSQMRGGDPFTSEILAFAGWNRLLNMVFDDGDRVLDVTGYDENVCSGITTGCVSTSSITVDVTPSNGHSPRQQAVFGSMGAVDTIEFLPGLFAEYSEPVVMTTGFQGGRIYYKQGRVRVVYGNAGMNNHEFSISQPNSWVEIPGDADFLILDDDNGQNQPGTGPFEVTFCTVGDV